jgi:hypothetical protein
VRVTRLTLGDFKRHARLVVEPASGLTVVRGPNEAGKTTIQRALELALCRKVTSADAEIREAQRWGAREDHTPVVELEFEVDGEHGRLRKAFRGARGQVELVVGERKTSDPAEADGWLAELTGIPTEKFFRSTASVRHHEVMTLDHDEANLRDRLQQSISGGDRGISAAKRRLDDAIKGLRAAGPKNPGPIKRAEDERNRLAEALQRGEEALARLERDRAEHLAARARREGTDAEIAQVREQLAQAELAVTLAAERDRATERYERYRAAAEIEAEMAGLQRQRPSPLPLATLRERVEEARALEVVIAESRAMLEADELPAELEVPPPPRFQPMLRLGLALAIAGLLVMGAQAWGRILQVLPALADSPVVTVGATLVALLGAMALLIGFRRRAEARRGPGFLRQEALERRLRGRSRAEERLRESEARKAEVLAAVGQPSTEAAGELLGAADEHEREIEVLGARLKEVLREGAVEDVPRARDEAAAEAERKTSALQGMGEIGREPAASRDRFSARLQALGLERDAAMREEAGLAERVEQNAVDATEVAAAAEALDAAAERLAALQRRLRIYETTLGALSDAEAATMKKVTAFLEERMAADVATLTGGRYDRVRVGDELRIELWSPERGDWVPVEALSQGTIDQVYLAARIQLVRLVTQDRRPPLLFDDPFVTYDDERAARAVDLLRAIAADHQILYFTTSQRYDGVADKVVELPAPGGQRR